MMIDMWRKSTKCDKLGGCIEAGATSGIVGVRDTTEETRPYRTTLQFRPAAWEEFIATVKRVNS